jgi:hypothetical protein
MDPAVVARARPHDLAGRSEAGNLDGESRKAGGDVEFELGSLRVADLTGVTLDVDIGSPIVGIQSGRSTERGKAGEAQEGASSEDGGVHRGDLGVRPFRFKRRGFSAGSRWRAAA